MTSFTIRDATGWRFALDVLPRRVVTLTPALAEQVYTLGRGRSIVGVTIRSAHPPAAARKPCVGDLHHPEVSRILALRPDLVLASRELNRRETVEALRAHGLRVFVFPAYSSCAEVFAGFCALGRLLGCVARAQQLVTETARALQGPRSRGRPRVFVQVWTAPLMGVARGSYIHDLIERCGGKNVSGRMRGRIVECSEEEVVRANPEVILITLRKAAPEFHRWRGHPELSAVQQRRIHAIPAYWLTPSPPALRRGARELRKLFAGG